MPPTRVSFYVADDGSAPVLAWLRALERRRLRAAETGALQKLRLFGHELRRPVADHAKGDLRELRVRFGTTNYRFLYAGQGAAVVLHAFTKEDRIPESEIARAMRRLKRFDEDPEGHRHEEEGTA